MNSHRARKALGLFREVNKLPEADRSPFLENECGSDLELRAELESLIASDRAEWSGLDHPPLNEDLSAVLQDLGEILSAGFLAAERYRIVERLGEGGMGMVYRAVQDNPRREVALKVIKSNSAELLRRFDREIDILARLSHPGIARIYDAGELQTSVGRRPFLAMELIKGIPINSYVKAHHLDIPSRLELFAKVCDAIQYAHQAGVIHRDLKPENILVEETKSGPRPRILDFGVGAVMDHSAVTLATAPGCLIGTIAYMSPEQVSGRVGTQSDVYSLGVILYEILCGRLPIQLNGDVLASVLRRLQDEAPVPISRRNPQLRGDLETIVMKSLEKEPSRRYPSADAVATDIRRHLQHEPILARRPSATYVVGRFARRHRLLVGVSSVAAAAVIVAAIGMYFAMIRVREAKESAVALAGVLSSRALPMLTDQIGTRADRRVLADEAHTASLSLLRHSPNDPTVLSVYADSLRQLSRVALDDGDAEKTLKLCERALTAREQAGKFAPDDLDLMSVKSIDMVLIGDAWRLQDRIEETRDWYQRAEYLQSQLAAASPSAGHLEQFAWSQHRLCHLAIADGRWNEASERAKRMMDLCQRVFVMRPDDLTALDGLREAHVCIAVVRHQRGDRTNAIAHLEHALTLGRRLLAGDPQNRIYLRGFLCCVVERASWDDGADEHDLCRDLVDEAIPIAERFHDADPADWTGIRVLARLLGRLAILIEREGNAGFALATVSRQLKLYKSNSHRITRHNAQQIQSDFQIAGALFHRLGRDDESRFAWKESVRLLELDAGQSDPSAESLAQLASLLLNCEWPEIRHPGRALQLAKRAVELKEQDANYWRVLASCYDAAGEGEQARFCQAKIQELAQRNQ